MIYRILQFLMRLSLSAHYKRIFLEGKENLNEDLPLLIASTHPNSFLDAIILGSVIDRPMYFLARSDVFNTRLSNYILRKLNLIPIYRLQEGHENLNKNDQTFEACFELLEQNQAVLIFAEGISLTDRLVRKPKKGLARIGFGAENRNEFNLNIQVQTVGLNYEEATGFGNRVLIHFAKPFAVRDFKDQYLQNANLGFESLNKKLYNTLLESSVVVEEEDDQLFEYLSHQLPDHRFRLDQLNKIAHAIHSIKKRDKQAYETVKQSAVLLEKKFGKSHLDFPGMERNHSFYPLRMIFQFSLASMGYLLNRIPFLLGQQIAKKTVKLPEFFASVKLAVSTLIWLIYAWGIALFLAIKFSPYYLALPILMFMLGKGYQHFSRDWAEFQSSRKKKSLEKMKDTAALVLAYKSIQEFMSDYALKPLT